jgi:hypothetical protein
MGSPDAPAIRHAADRGTECQYCQANWPFFGAIDGQPLPFHHHPSNPNWHARVTCQAASVVPVDPPSPRARVVKERIRAFRGAA